MMNIDKDIAKSVLQKSNWDVEVSITSYFENPTQFQPGNNPQSQSGTAPAASGSQVSGPQMR